MSNSEAPAEENLNMIIGVIEDIVLTLKEKAKRDYENISVIQANEKELVERVNYLEKTLFFVSLIAIGNLSTYNNIVYKDIVEHLKEVNKELAVKYKKETI